MLVRTVPRLVALAIAAALAAGCSTLPTQPQVSPATQPTLKAGWAAEPAKQKSKTPPPSTGGVSARIQGNRGGTLRAGAFTVVVPPGAFSGFATLTVTQPDPSQPRVDLGIEPATKNGFRVPVTLLYDLSNADPRVIPGTSVSELLASNDWSPVPGSTPDVEARLVSAPLAHFSTYRVEIPPPPAPSPSDKLPRFGR